MSNRQSEYVASKNRSKIKTLFHGLSSLTNAYWYDGVGAYDIINVPIEEIEEEEEEEYKNSVRWLDSAL